MGGGGGHPPLASLLGWDPRSPHGAERGGVVAPLFQTSASVSGPMALILPLLLLGPTRLGVYGSGVCVGGGSQLTLSEVKLRQPVNLIP